MRINGTAFFKRGFDFKIKGDLIPEAAAEEIIALTPTSASAAIGKPITTERRDVKNLPPLTAPAKMPKKACVLL